MFTGRWLVENSIAQVIKSSIIIRNLAAFYNYNFEIGIRERRKFKGERRKEGRGGGETGYREQWGLGYKGAGFKV